MQFTKKINHASFLASVVFAASVIAQPGTVREVTVVVPGPFAVYDCFAGALDEPCVLPSLAIDLDGVNVPAGSYERWSLLVDWEERDFSVAFSSEMQVYLSESPLEDSISDNTIRYSGEGGLFPPTFESSFDDPFPVQDLAWQDRILEGYEGGQPLFLHARQLTPSTSSTISNVRLTLRDLPLDFSELVVGTVSVGDIVSADTSTSLDLVDGSSGPDGGPPPPGRVDFRIYDGNDDVYLLDWPGGLLEIDLCYDTFRLSHQVFVFDATDSRFLFNSIQDTNDDAILTDLPSGQYYLVIDDFNPVGGPYSLRINASEQCPPQPEPIGELFAVNSGSLYRLDKANGVVSFVGDVRDDTPNQFSVQSLMGIAMDSTGVMYAVQQGGFVKLWRINTQSAAAHEVGLLNQRCPGQVVSPLSNVPPDEADVTQFLSWLENPPFIISDNLDLVEPDGLDLFDLLAHLSDVQFSLENGCDLSLFFLEGSSAFDANDTLWISGTQINIDRTASSPVHLANVDLQTGKATLGVELSYPAEQGVVSGRWIDLNGMAFRSDGVLIALEATSGHLVEVHTMTGVITTLADLEGDPGSIGGMAITPQGEGYYVTSPTNPLGGPLGDSSLYRFDPFTGEQELVSPLEEALFGFGLMGLTADR